MRASGARAGRAFALDADLHSRLRGSVSLIQLVILLVPLAALVIGVLSFTSERGAAEILFSQPVSRTKILAGQMLGIFAALTAAQLVGFGAAGIVISQTPGARAWAHIFY